MVAFERRASVFVEQKETVVRVLRSGRPRSPDEHLIIDHSITIVVSSVGMTTGHRWIVSRSVYCL